MNTRQPSIQHLSNRTIFRVTGSDAIRYINGQVSQDASLASHELAVYSIVADFKGKVQGDLYLRLYNGELLIDTSESQRESLLIRLDKYLIADDAEIEDITDEFELYHIIGDEQQDLTVNALANWNCDRYGVNGKDYLCGKTYLYDQTDSHETWEAFRVSQQIPNWDNELNLNLLPPEAGLEDRAISYTKGCYTGQEVISRMKSAGKTNRHLVKFRFEKEIAVPLELYCDPKAEGKVQATITSSCKTNSNDYIGLGFRARKSEAVNTFYDTEGNTYQVL